MGFHWPNSFSTESNKEYNIIYLAFWMDKTDFLVNPVYFETNLKVIKWVGNVFWLEFPIWDPSLENFLLHNDCNFLFFLKHLEKYMELNLPEAPTFLSWSILRLLCQPELKHRAITESISTASNQNKFCMGCELTITRVWLWPPPQKKTHKKHPKQNKETKRKKKTSK